MAKKRSAVKDTNVKRQKVVAVADVDVQSSLLSIDDIKSIHSKINESSKNYNNIVQLLKQYDLIIPIYNNCSNDQDVDLKSRFLSLTLYKIFSKLISSNKLKVSFGASNELKLVCKWLKAKYDDFKTQLFKIINIKSVDDENDDENEGLYSLKIDSLDLLMKLLNLESQYFSPNENEPYFANLTYKKILINLLKTGELKQILKHDATINNYLLLEFQESYFNKYWDLKYFMFNELQDIINSLDNDTDKQLLVSNVLTLLKSKSIYNITEIDEITSNNYTSNPPLKTISNITQFNSNFEKSILKLINLPLLSNQYKSILLILHKRIIPFFNNPTNLMDFLTDSYNIGFKLNDISISILSLNGLWELINNYNLNYPEFFIKLYAILTPDLLHLNYKSRFLRLLDIFMTSTHLSSSIVASFIKKFSKLSLTAPPSGIVCIIPFIYNLMKRHPTCMLLIHSTSDPLNDANYIDPFNDLEHDPSLTNAINSSIWELQSQIQHYHPNVSSLAKIITQPFNKYNYNIEDFLDWNYEKLINSELSKKYKGELSIEFEKWNKLLGGLKEDDTYLKDYDY
ncbi:hypothetical protein CANARDRAFT_213866 [[Candida] arabinofermentans NRRL YB-2248]|uniref:CCAAT-binding factor domain-containing protein n=1 Tax=[Candida] arabinofermentans NRRL YB-2248 TaxID=983967 RepID=A0A1E4SWU5_9ASCO|nr:hypothetical protein CANARDRAFT_213866 [[Candida] arabinofermentans NRRL YB-2248]